MDPIAGQVVRARSERLVTKTVGDEIVIYDLDTDKAHLLNPAAAVLWRLCEKGATVGVLRAALEAELNTNGTTDELLWTALDDLSKAGLLDTDTSVVGRPSGMTRRSLLKKAGLVALAAPVITTILAPPAAASHTGRSCIAPSNDGLNTCGGTGHDSGTCCANSSCQTGKCRADAGQVCDSTVLCNTATTCGQGGPTATGTTHCCYTYSGTGPGPGPCNSNDNACCGSSVCNDSLGVGGTCANCFPLGTSAARDTQCCSGLRKTYASATTCCTPTANGTQSCTTNGACCDAGTGTNVKVCRPASATDVGVLGTNTFCNSCIPSGTGVNNRTTSATYCCSGQTTISGGKTVCTG